MKTIRNIEMIALEFMCQYALVAQYKMPEMEQIVVFGAMPKGSMGQSETIIVADARTPLTPEERITAARIMKQHSILNDVTIKKSIRWVSL